MLYSKTKINQKSKTKKRKTNFKMQINSMSFKEMKKAIDLAYFILTNKYQMENDIFYENALPLETIGNALTHSFKSIDHFVSAEIVAECQKIKDNFYGDIATNNNDNYNNMYQNELSEFNSDDTDIYD